MIDKNSWLLIEIGVQHQNNGLWSWFPLSISRRFQVVSLAYVFHGLFMWKKTYSASLLLGKKVEDENLEWE